jgi:hypothetical protein
VKINRFKIKNNITKNDLIALGFKKGGSWIKKDAELFLSRCFYYKETDFEYSIGIAFGSNINEWNDFDNVLILDEDFCQPYTPFYGDNYGKDITDFPTLENVILSYNEFMKKLNVFDEVKDNT